MVTGDRWRRAWRNLVAERGLARRAFDDAALDRIEAAIAAAESRHGAEIVVAFEARLPIAEVLRGVTPRDRALAAFAELGVWDTERNAGVLVHLLLAEHAIEIVADRGVAGLIPPAAWQAIVDRIQRGFAAGEPVQGVVDAVAAIAERLAAAVPVELDDRNERPDRPVRLR